MSDVFNLIEEFLHQYEIATERWKTIIENCMENETLPNTEREYAKCEGMKQAINTISHVIHTIRVVREMDSD